MTPQDRRFEPRSAANARAVVVAPGLKQGAESPLRGLILSRLAAARDAFLRAGGR